MKPDFSRFEKVLYREEPDMVPLYEHIVDHHFMQAITHRRIPFSGINKRQKGKHVRALSKFWQGVGYDYIPLELGLKIKRSNVVVSHDKEPLGAHRRSWVDDNRSTIGSMEDFLKYSWPELEDAIDYDLLRVAGKNLPPNVKLVSGVAGGVHEHVMWLVGIRPLSIALRREPNFVDAIFKKVGNLIAEVDKIIVEFDHVGALRMGDDMGFKGSTLLSPKILREHVFPQQKKIVEVAHKKSKPFILHSCGNLSEIMEDLIEDVKIDAWHSFQDLIIPVTAAKAKFGDRVAILGGVDLDVLSRQSLPEVTEYCTRVLKECKIGGGYAFGSGNSIPTYVKVENYLKMIEIWKKCRTY